MCMYMYIYMCMYMYPVKKDIAARASILILVSIYRPGLYLTLVVYSNLTPLPTAGLPTSGRCKGMKRST